MASLYKNPSPNRLPGCGSSCHEKECSHKDMKVLPLLPQHAGVAIAKITDDDEEETDQLMEELL